MGENRAAALPAVRAVIPPAPAAALGRLKLEPARRPSPGFPEPDVLKALRALPCGKRGGCTSPGPTSSTGWRT
ncbi:hypothetical protein [Amycolatopsis tolypomycina]|uniref:hypothetical protein n=1 Tax=Amycolatopsis tolypomycina TaxID=208445 RepID=UPI0033B68BDB